MVNAKIINNKPHCAECGRILERGIRDYDIAYKNGESYLRFDKHCNYCNTDNRYYMDTDFNNRHSFDTI